MLSAIEAVKTGAVPPWNITRFSSFLHAHIPERIRAEKINILDILFMTL
jgi:hypothetical protein